MKKLTFIEALKANETKIIIEAFPPPQRNTLIFSPNEMINSRIAISELSRIEWTTEPEKFEFMCGWVECKDEDNNTRARPLVYLQESISLRSLIGKRTKVTIEVIDE
jgi:hypothetical protein